MITITKQYWWSGTANFGDLIGPIITNHYLGKDLTLAKSNDENVLLGPGSIIDYCKRFKSSIVWGSGIDPHYGEKPKATDQVQYLAVRGPKTREFLEIDVDVLGDPGLLMPEIYPKKPTSGPISVVIHHSTAKRRLRDFLFDPYRSGLHIIDPTQSYETVIDEICGSSFCFCQSLHGAILAEAYGVPWVWWRGLHGQLAKFKWHDWFASISVEPKSFRLSEIKKASQWASKKKSRIPDINALKQTLVENVK